jgi:YidC/Oxa1 family membrane protein insertase
METKRLILAIALSMVVIVVYQFLFMPKPPPKKTQPEQAAQEQVVPGKQASAETRETTAPKDSEEMTDIFSRQKEEKTVEPGTQVLDVKENLSAESVSDVVVDTDLFTAVFTNEGAGLKSFVLKKYLDDKKQPLELISDKVNEKFGPYKVYPFHFSPFDSKDENIDLFLDVNTRKFAIEGESSVTLSPGQSREIVFKYADSEKDISVVKRFFISGSSYVIEVDMKVIKDGQVINEAPFVFGPDLENNMTDDRVMQSPLRIAGYQNEDINDQVFEKVSTEKVTKTIERGEGSLGKNFSWASYDTTYFGAIFKTRGDIDYAVVKKIEDEDKKTLFSYIIITTPEPFHMYLGPKDEQILETVQRDYGFREPGQVVDYGWAIFGGIARVLLKGIVFIHGFVPNYGWALVIFTIFIKILLFPLTYTSSVSMAKMQALQPKLKAIKKKYKNQKDPEQRRQMQVETMALYKQEKVNPAGGCLPMLLQMPILFAFFRLLPISINFRHEPWMLWIQDLSIKDPIYALPILMGLTQIIVSKMSPTSGDDTQKKMMYIMPVVMVVLFLNYSAGLNLYWFIANLLQIGQQHFINKTIFKKRKEEEQVRRAQKRKKGGKNK